jgi:hypothetical protein
MDPLLERCAVERDLGVSTGREAHPVGAGASPEAAKESPERVRDRTVPIHSDRATRDQQVGLAGEPAHESFGGPVGVVH